MKTITLRTARTKAGLTQEQLEDKSGISQAAISKLESGDSLRPSFETVMALAKALRVDPQSLKFGPDGGEQDAVA